MANIFPGILAEASRASSITPAVRGILWIVGLGLLVLGGIAGGVLLWKAAFARDKDEFGGSGTLWGLFVVGLIGGIILVAWSAQIW